ncbi:hypothetical protein K469DRAFT_277703 [Zopfia rhizophila CBS 207.26]|uniref:Uncharacterized protein n=1 Tax=Zopfia rhizophila CBS 207.26 TaxID=1314779 RepID=A0A6A6DLF8_9PEZI|nr:hypothetical protein K469DRAFT_277703 [Zopfia rhizophila CBS 207.26]
MLCRTRGFKVQSRLAYIFAPLGRSALVLAGGVVERPSVNHVAESTLAVPGQRPSSPRWTARSHAPPCPSRSLPPYLSHPALLLPPIAPHPSAA